MNSDHALLLWHAGYLSCCAVALKELNTEYSSDDVVVMSSGFLVLGDFNFFLTKGLDRELELWRKMWACTAFIAGEKDYQLHCIMGNVGSNGSGV